MARLAPVYQAASRARKQLLLDEVIQKTGYARKSAIRLLNHPPTYSQHIRRLRQPCYRVRVQQALVLAWKAAHFVCAKRLMPSLPALVEGLERRQHLRLTEEERGQVQTMSVATAERFLRTQSKPRVSGFSPTTPGELHKSQIPVRTFAPWEDARPGFVEMDLVAHCGTHIDGGFLFTLTLIVHNRRVPAKMHSQTSHVSYQKPPLINNLIIHLQKPPILQAAREPLPIYV